MSFTRAALQGVERYTDQDYVVIVGSVFSLNVIVVVAS